MTQEVYWYSTYWYSCLIIHLYWYDIEEEEKDRLEKLVPAKPASRLACRHIQQENQPDLVPPLEGSQSILLTNLLHPQVRERSDDGALLQRQEKVKLCRFNTASWNNLSAPIANLISTQQSKQKLAIYQISGEYLLFESCYTSHILPTVTMFLQQYIQKLSATIGTSDVARKQANNKH